MKKLLLISSLFAVSGFSISAQASWVGNWLVGASVGYANQTASFNTQLTYVNPSNPNITFPITKITKDHGDVGFLGGVLFGYQAICRKWLVGVEFNTEWRDLDQGHPFTFEDIIPLIEWEGSERYGRKRIGALTGRIGYAIEPYFMPYGRLGVELGRDRFQTTFDTNHAVDTHWTHRFLLGLGFEIPLPRTCGATFRLEYNFSSKGRTIEITQVQVVETGQNTLFATFSSAMQPITQSWKGSLVWNFF